MRTYNVSSLADFYRAVTDIGEKRGVKRLWFRGHTYNHYHLLPGLYRGNYYIANENMTYSDLDLREDYRYQHLKARVFHNVHSNPVHRNEWQEVYQHHLGLTRLMDWSESAKTALSFALEALIDTRQNILDLEYKRKNMTPKVWVLDPLELNLKVYEYLAGDTSEPQAEICLERVLDEVDLSARVSVFQNELERSKDIYFKPAASDLEVEGIMSLCVLEDQRRMMGAQLKKRIQKFEMNPFHYMILRLYADAVPYLVTNEKQCILPPIAVLHPYHSERIRKQRGVFTAFPNYVMEDRVKQYIVRRGKDIREMEKQSYIDSCLDEINIVAPGEVARELIYSGERRTELYPDIEVYAQVMETQQYPV